MLDHATHPHAKAKWHWDAKKMKWHINRLSRLQNDHHQKLTQLSTFTGNGAAAVPMKPWNIYPFHHFQSCWITAIALTLLCLSVHSCQQLASNAVWHASILYKCAKTHTPGLIKLSLLLGLNPQPAVLENYGSHFLITSLSPTWLSGCAHPGSRRAQHGGTGAGWHKGRVTEHGLCPVAAWAYNGRASKPSNNREVQLVPKTNMRHGKTKTEKMWSVDREMQWR